MDIIIKVVDMPTGRLIEQFRFGASEPLDLLALLKPYELQLFRIEITFDYPAGTFDSAS